MEKKGIKLTTFIIILVLLVVCEGVYIVNLKSKENSNNLVEIGNNSTSKSEENTIGNDNETKANANAENLVNENNITSTDEQNIALESNITNSNETNVVSSTESNSEPKTENKVNTTQVVKSFGYDINSLADNILDSIEKYAGQGMILKSADCEKTAEKLSVDEAKQNRANYKTKIIESLNKEGFINKLSFENGKLVCVYNFEKILNDLKIESHSDIKNETDENGCKTFEF